MCSAGVFAFVGALVATAAPGIDDFPEPLPVSVAALSAPGISDFPEPALLLPADGATPPETIPVVPPGDAAAVLPERLAEVEAFPAGDAAAAVPPEPLAELDALSPGDAAGCPPCGRRGARAAGV